MTKDFLTTIVQAKRDRVAAAKKRISESDLYHNFGGGRVKRPFFHNLSVPGAGGLNIIAEIKRASPSKGPIREDLDPARFASSYEKGGAAAVSVLTDERFFNGSLADLRRARAATTLPVLRKDFIISSYQIHEAYAAGADAVLLIARILDREMLKDFMDICRDIDMDTLVEIHREKDIETAALAGAELIGINNRDLSSFKTDIQTAFRLAAMLAPGQIPVAASGIRSREDIVRTKKAGIFNFLIGESLVRAENTEAFLKSLLGAQAENGAL
ncbi:MAG: indole-3-glycerol phosphate synthase TrpC [Desulfobacterales bacterium]